MPRVVWVCHKSDCQQLHMFGGVSVTFQLATFPGSVYFPGTRPGARPAAGPGHDPAADPGSAPPLASAPSARRQFLPVQSLISHPHSPRFRSDPVAEPGGGAVTSSSGFASGWFRSGSDAVDEEIDLTM